MVQEKRQESYRGVLCSFCRQPIPLPAIVARAEEARNGPGADRAFDGVERSFHIRCRACEKEASYHSRDVVDVEGAPRLRNFQMRSAERSGFLRGHGDLAKAANG